MDSPNSFIEELSSSDTMVTELSDRAHSTGRVSIKFTRGPISELTATEKEEVTLTRTKG